MRLLMFDRSAHVRIVNEGLPSDLNWTTFDGLLYSRIHRFPGTSGQHLRWHFEMFD
jgi:hypothetical protein